MSYSERSQDDYDGFDDGYVDSEFNSDSEE